MEEENKENLDSEIEEAELEEVEEVEEVEEKPEVPKQKQEYTEREKQYFARIKKLETQLAEKSEGTLSAKDLIALTKAGIEAEDIDEVTDYARYKKIPLHEALNSPVIKATLAEKAEIRKSAAVAHAGKGRRGTTETSDQRLLADAEAGKLPETDAEMQRLIALRWKNRN